MSGLTSQPPMGAICSALEQTGLGTGIRYEDIQALNLYWSQVRMLYACFEANVRASDSSVFAHEMPGGQYTNLMVSSSLASGLDWLLIIYEQFQASQLGLGAQWTGLYFPLSLRMHVIKSRVQRLRRSTSKLMRWYGCFNCSSLQ